ncbi:basic secretory protein-like protein [Pseudoalteromonas piscicida]|uniref:basic secretory protein-like protein n=1 Tax=Pseudoalteromonas piscicida TaxID=43662 RepID=UPI0027397F3C|nr:basic secretory protein-like protein [Pseudoalteromonas piscicida]MDP4486486.1 basic secretory protein-like protein [Pseudoalteromonas piscicida]
MKTSSLASLILLSFCGSSLANANALYDITERDAFSVTSDVKEQIQGEGIEQLVDRSLKSKFLSKQSSAEIVFDLKDVKALGQYSLTSAQDAPARDPKHWTVAVSVDGKAWQEADKRNNIVFSRRGETLTFDLAKTTDARYVRFTIAQEGKTQWGDRFLQIADLALYAQTNLPLANFTADKTVAKLNEPISLQSISANSPTALNWKVEGKAALPTTNSVEVVYDKPGNYNVTLMTKNAHGSDLKTRANYLKIYDPTQPWKGFEPPKVKVVIEDTESAGSKRLQALFPDIASTVDDVTRQLAPRLYKHFAELPEFEQVTFRLKWMDTIAYRSGDETNMEIVFSSKYITEKLAAQPDEQVEYELLGVLWHELTHGYQLFPKERSYAEPDVHAFIEGMADLIRIQAGFHKTRSPKPSDSWVGGYTNTGFFLAWLAESHPDFAYRFNQTAVKLEDWSFEDAIKSVTGESLDKLWSRYQSELNTKKLQ